MISWIYEVYPYPLNSGWFQWFSSINFLVLILADRSWPFLQWNHATKTMNHSNKNSSVNDKDATTPARIAGNAAGPPSGPALQCAPCPRGTYSGALETSDSPQIGRALQSLAPAQPQCSLDGLGNQSETAHAETVDPGVKVGNGGMIFNYRGWLRTHQLVAGLSHDISHVYIIIYNVLWFLWIFGISFRNNGSYWILLDFFHTCVVSMNIWDIFRNGSFYIRSPFNDLQTILLLGAFHGGGMIIPSSGAGAAHGLAQQHWGGRGRSWMWPKTGNKKPPVFFVGQMRKNHLFTGGLSGHPFRNGGFNVRIINEGVGKWSRTGGKTPFPKIGVPP